MVRRTGKLTQAGKQTALLCLILTAVALSGCQQAGTGGQQQSQPSIQYQCPDGTWVESKAMCAGEAGNGSNGGELPPIGEAGDVYYEVDYLNCIDLFGEKCRNLFAKVWRTEDKFRADTYKDGELYAVEVADGSQYHVYGVEAGEWATLTGRAYSDRMLAFRTGPCWPSIPSSAQYAENLSTGTIDGIEVQTYDCSIALSLFRVWYWREKDMYIQFEHWARQGGPESEDLEIMERKHRKNFRFEAIPDSVFQKTLGVD